MNVESPGRNWDSKFLMMLAMDVFGEECLSESSVFGRLAWNSNVRHAALNKVKLKFVQGIIVVAITSEFSLPAFSISIFEIQLTDFFQTDIFCQRVGQNAERAASFARIINKQCNNLRHLNR